MNAKQSPVTSLTFEVALAELESIVKDMETGKAALDDSIASYERGVALKNHCEKKLREAQSKIESITVTADGKVKTKPFDEQE